MCDVLLCSSDAKVNMIYVYENKRLSVILQQRDPEVRKLLPTEREDCFPTYRNVSPDSSLPCTIHGADQGMLLPEPGKAISRTKFRRSSSACVASEPTAAETANRETFSGRPANRDSACINLIS